MTMKLKKLLKYHDHGLQPVRIYQGNDDNKTKQVFDGKEYDLIHGCEHYLVESTVIRWHINIRDHVLEIYIRWEQNHEVEEFAKRMYEHC